MRVMHTLRSHLLVNLGLSSIALTACQGEQAEPELPALGPPLEASFEDMNTAQLAPPGALSLALASSAFDTGATITFSVAGAAPGSFVFLGGAFGVGTGSCPTPLPGGLCLDLQTPALLAAGQADASGSVDIDIILPFLLPDGLPLYLQAVNPGSLSTSNVFTDVTTHPPRDCVEAPFLNNTNPYSSTDFITCVPPFAGGFCPPASSLTYLQEEAAFQLITGFNPNPGYFDISCDETTIESACCYGSQYYQVVIGRPFRVHGESRTADLTARKDWSATVQPSSHLALAERLGAEWAHTAAAEHASIAAFARFNLELLSLGAPSDLVLQASQAMVDETRHAQAAYTLASRFMGHAVGPNTLPVADALAATPNLRDIFLDVVREGCIAETVAAAEAARARDLTTDDAIRDVLAMIARDETNHASLAWNFARWAISQDASLANLLEQEVASAVMPGPVAVDPDRKALNAHGVLDDAQRASVRRHALVEVIRPCAAAILAELTRAAA